VPIPSENDDLVEKVFGRADTGIVEISELRSERNHAVKTSEVFWWGRKFVILLEPLRLTSSLPFAKILKDGTRIQEYMKKFFFEYEIYLSQLTFNAFPSFMLSLFSPQLHWVQSVGKVPPALFLLTGIGTSSAVVVCFRFSVSVSKAIF